jgi:hypothetical protein
MRRTILLGLCALLAVGAASNARAQHYGGHGLARGGYHFSPDRSGRAFNRPRSGHAFRHARGRYGLGSARAISPYGYGYLPDDSGLFDDSGAAYPEQEPQPVVFVQQQPVVVRQEAPPAVQQPAEPVIKEYKWPTAAVASSGPNFEPQVFAIVLKDGSTLSAVTVYACKDGLHFVDPDERHLLISMSDVDRAATLKLNRARNLNLYLPAAE